MPDPTRAELAATINAMITRVVAWQFPASLRGDAGADAFDRYQELRRLSVENTLEGLQLAARLTQAGHLGEADAIIDRAAARWTRWLRQANSITQRSVAQNAGITRELSIAFTGAVDAITAELPDLPSLPSLSNIGMGIGVSLAIAAFAIITMMGRRRR